MPASKLVPMCVQKAQRVKAGIRTAQATEPAKEKYLSGAGAHWTGFQPRSVQVGLSRDISGISKLPVKIIYLPIKDISQDTN